MQSFLKRRLIMITLKFRQGFTLVEIMIVVAIIALLAAIAIPNLLRAKVAANDSGAKGALRNLATAAESFAVSNQSNYPLDISSLTNVNPSYYLNKNYCNGNPYSGFTYNCTFGAAGYAFQASPITMGVTGTTSYTITTGAVLAP